MEQRRRSKTSPGVLAALLALVPAGVAQAQQPPQRSRYTAGQVTHQGSRSTLTMPTVVALNPTVGIDAQRVMYRALWLPASWNPATSQWEAQSARALVTAWVFTEVGEVGSGRPLESSSFFDVRSRQPVGAHHADLAPGAYLLQAELHWLPAGSDQPIHVETAILGLVQVSALSEPDPSPPSTAGPAAPARPQPTPGPSEPSGHPQQPPVERPETEQWAVSGTGFAVGPRSVLTNAHVVLGHDVVLIECERELVPCQVVAVNEELDLALIEHDMPGEPLAASLDISSGQGVFAYG